MHAVGVTQGTRLLLPGAVGLLAGLRLLSATSVSHRVWKGCERSMAAAL